MLDDVERLDTLINHMLDAARLDQRGEEETVGRIDLSAVLRSCAETACLRYHLPLETIQLRLVARADRGEADRRGDGVSQPDRQRHQVRRQSAAGGDRSHLAPGADVRRHTHHRQRRRHSGQAAAQDFWPLRAAWAASWNDRRPAPAWDCSSSARWSNACMARSPSATAHREPARFSKSNYRRPWWRVTERRRSCGEAVHGSIVCSDLQSRLRITQALTSVGVTLRVTKPSRGA